MISKKRIEATEEMTKRVEKKAQDEQDKIIMTMIPGLRKYEQTEEAK